MTLETEDRSATQVEQVDCKLPPGFFETRLLSLQEIAKLAGVPLEKDVINFNGASIYQEKDEKTGELVIKAEIAECERTWPAESLDDIKNTKKNLIIPLTNPDSSTVIVRDGAFIHFVYGGKKEDPSSGMSFWVSVSKDSSARIGSQPLLSMEDCTREGIPAKVYEAAIVSRSLPARKKQVS